MLTDFHSHILPGIDDGSRNLAESLAMLRQISRQGIGRVILTPHFYPNYSTPERFLDRREQAWRLLQEHLEPDMPHLELGAEVHFYPHMSHSEELRKLTIGDTSCILIEMPSSKWTPQMYRELERLHTNLGLTPVIAHVDRYLGRFRDHGIPKQLSRLPVYVQANAEFFLDRRTAAKALRMLQRGQIHVLGSDCHNMTSRQPRLGEAITLIRRKLGDDAIDWLVSNGREILE